MNFIMRIWVIWLNKMRQNLMMTNLNDDGVEYKEENVTTDSEINAIAKNDDNLTEICEGKEINDEGGRKDVASVEEARMSSMPC